MKKAYAIRFCSPGQSWMINRLTIQTKWIYVYNLVNWKRAMVLQSQLKLGSWKGNVKTGEPAGLSNLPFYKLPCREVGPQK